MNIYSIIKPLLFTLDEETAHKVSLSLLKFMPTNFIKINQTYPVNCMGLNFPHPIGLGAGFDKNGEFIDALAKLGFAFIEVGTVTPKAQPGNAKKRLFRIPKAHGIINKMGFNNLGVDNLVANIKSAKYNGILGINIGKNSNTPLKDAIDDYIFCMQKVYPYASYITVNISSPNTKDLRLLQSTDYFKSFIKTLCEFRGELCEEYKRYVPLVIKLSPDESDSTLKSMAAVILEYKIDGIIATNTTADRVNVSQFKYANEQGGLSGRPLREKSLQCLIKLKDMLKDEVTLIGSGGVDCIDVVQEKLHHGASLVQVYTGLIYEGPGLIKKLIKDLNYEKNTI